MPIGGPGFSNTERKWKFRSRHPDVSVPSPTALIGTRFHPASTSSLFSLSTTACRRMAAHAGQVWHVKVDRMAESESNTGHKHTRQRTRSGSTCLVKHTWHPDRPRSTGRYPRNVGMTRSVSCRRHSARNWGSRLKYSSTTPVRLVPASSIIISANDFHPITTQYSRTLVDLECTALLFQLCITSAVSPGPSRSTPMP